MDAENPVVFSQKWIGDAVRKLLQKEEITGGDMEKIRYLRIGQDNGFVVEMSLTAPPDPFCDADGGDEWTVGRYGATATGRFIRLFIDYTKKHPFDYTNPDTGKRTFQLTQFEFWDEYGDEYGETEEEEEGEDWEVTVKKWRDFEKTIRFETYREKFDDDAAWEEWEQQTRRSIQQDIGLFTGVEVLRMQRAEYGDMTFLQAMPRLRTLEVVETRFHSLEGIDDLVRLKQFCCWLD